MKFIDCNEEEFFKTLDRFTNKKIFLTDSKGKLFKDNNGDKLKLITVINSGTGNIASVSRALNYVKIPHAVSDKPDEIAKSQKLIFPCVGNSLEVAVRLRALGLDKVLKDKVLGEKNTYFGNLPGYASFPGFGEEGGGAEGFNFTKGKVSRHRAAEHNLRLPHIGWNDVRSRF